MKTLTKEAKIHLAELAGMEYHVKEYSGKSDYHFFKSKSEGIIGLSEYNPNSPDSPMWQLRDLVLAFENNVNLSISKYKEFGTSLREEENCYSMWSTEYFRNPFKLVQNILFYTGYTGEVW